MSDERQDPLDFASAVALLREARAAIEHLDTELEEASAAAVRWYVAASPYATPDALKEALATRPEVAEWRKLEDTVSTPSTTHLLRADAQHSVMHWFTLMHKGEFYAYEVTVPPFVPPESRSPQPSES